MEEPKTSSTPLPSTRSKRSTTNLANLRLAPLSQKFQEPIRDDSRTKSLYEESADPHFTRNHPSYLHGKSAPTTPGILSRSSSRKYLGAGLSRRGSLYESDNEELAGMDYEGAGLGLDGTHDVRPAGQIPKAKSEAALQRHRLAGHGVPLKRRSQQYRPHQRSRTGGTNTPRAKSKPKTVEDDWLTRTGAAANAILQESKGQSWHNSRASSAAIAGLQDSSTDDNDEGYEELAALSASTTVRLQLADDELSPTSTRASRWGSRYGSRTASRRTSRRGSATGSRTPLAPTGGQDVIAGFFNEDALALPNEPDFVDADEENEEENEAAVARLADNRSFGLGGLVDRLMGFSLFKVEEREESTEDEEQPAEETEEEARERMAAENRRKREEKERLVALREATGKAGGGGSDEVEEEGGWKDAAWLLSVASKAMF